MPPTFQRPQDLETSSSADPVRFKNAPGLVGPHRKYLTFPFPIPKAFGIGIGRWKVFRPDPDFPFPHVQDRETSINVSYEIDSVRLKDALSLAQSFWRNKMSLKKFIE